MKEFRKFLKLEMHSSVKEVINAVAFSERIPFKDLPKFVNHENEIVKTIALQRLSGEYEKLFP